LKSSIKVKFLNLKLGQLKKVKFEKNKLIRVTF
jgi:hypothetical protein